MSDIKAPLLRTHKGSRDALRTAVKALAVKAAVPQRAGEGRVKLMERVAVKLGAVLPHDVKEEDLYAFLITKLVTLL